MKVKIKNKIYNSKDEPIMIILTKAEQKQIAGMGENDTKYCSYPAYWTDDEITKWMHERIWEKPESIGSKDINETKN